MVLHPHDIKSIPSLTKEIAQKAFPKGNLYMTLRNKLGSFYDDELLAPKELKAPKNGLLS